MKRKCYNQSEALCLLSAITSFDSQKVSIVYSKNDAKYIEKAKGIMNGIYNIKNLQNILVEESIFDKEAEYLNINIPKENFYEGYIFDNAMEIINIIDKQKIPKNKRTVKRMNHPLFILATDIDYNQSELILEYLIRYKKKYKNKKGSKNFTNYENKPQSPFKYIDKKYWSTKWFRFLVEEYHEIKDNKKKDRIFNDFYKEVSDLKTSVFSGRIGLEKNNFEYQSNKFGKNFKFDLFA